METLQAELVETEVLNVIREFCMTLKIDIPIDVEFCPGNFIKSQVLLTAISTIQDALGVTIPNDCYVFSNKDNKQLSIKETAQKILTVAKYEN
jgi:hypothetical protein